MHPQLTSEAQRQLLDQGVGPSFLATAIGVSKQAASQWLRGNARPGFETQLEIEHLFAVPTAAWSYRPGEAPGHLVRSPGEAIFEVRVVALAAREQAALLDELRGDGVDAAADGASMVLLVLGSRQERDAVCATLKAEGYTFTLPGRPPTRRR